MRVPSMQWKWLKLDHPIFAPFVAAKSDTLACTSPIVSNSIDGIFWVIYRLNQYG